MEKETIKIFLIIENKIQAEFIESIFEEQSNYIVKKIFNGKEAYEELTSKSEEYIDWVIIMSYQLPGMDGLSMMANLKKMGLNFAIIFLTSDKTVERALEAMKSGAVDFIPKADNLPGLLPEMVDKVFYLQKDKIEQEKIKKELDESRRALEKLSIVARETNNGVLIYDKDGNIEWMNEGYTKLTGFTLSEYIDRYGKNIIIDIYEEELIKDIQNCIKLFKSSIFTVKTKTKEDKDIWLQTNLTPVVDDEGTLSKLVKVISDITDIKRAEAEIVKHKENIEHSIHYAKRIQEALFPKPTTVLKGIISELLVFLRPRDIVSGDFYWFNQTEDKILIAAADCTGHGVPGSFMSMLGISSLNVIVRQLFMKAKDSQGASWDGQEFIQSDAILNMLKEEVIRSLRQTGEAGEAQDGMDIALSVIDIKEHTLQFSGAYNPLFLIRDGELIETKADKMPIGIHRKKSNPFTANNIKLLNNDVIYMFSDGFVDQFGGEEGGKFMLKNFKELLLNIYQKPMTEQSDILDETIKKWRGFIPQTDDMLVIGVRFSI